MGGGSGGVLNGDARQRGYMTEPTKSVVELNVPVFRTTEPEVLAKAAALLDNAEVPYEVETRPGGGGNFRHRSSHTILVSQKHYRLSQELVSGLPSEFILEPGQRPTGHAGVSPKIVVVIIVASALFLVLAVVMGSCQ